MAKTKATPLDRVFHALADPTRRAILEQLKHSDSTLLELAEQFDMSFQAVAKHIKVLQMADLLHKEKEGRYQICKLHPAPLHKALVWLSQHHDMWKKSLEKLEVILDQEPEQEQP